jgi:hypothetical protein
MARARGAFSWARLVAASSTGNSASSGHAARREPNVAQHGLRLTDNDVVPPRLRPVLKPLTERLPNAEPTQTSMQLAWLRYSLRRGGVLRGAPATDTAAAR